jgi:hypothetical protein
MKVYLGRPGSGRFSYYTRWYLFRAAQYSGMQVTTLLNSGGRGFGRRVRRRSEHLGRGNP